MDTFGKAFQKLSAHGREHAVNVDALLWKEGDPGDDVVLLLEGRLEVVHETPDGEIIVLRELEAGSILGEIATVDGRTRSAAVRAAVPSRMLRVPAAEFKALMASDPELLSELFWEQVGRVRALTEQVVRSHRPGIIDRVTRLYNSQFFRDRLRTELERARETGDDMSIVVFDVDHFRQYADANGSSEANEALGHLAQILKTTGRRGDIVSRLAGGRFAILLYGATREDGARFAEKVRVRVEETDFRGASTQPLGRLTVSGGVATCPVDGTRPDTLFDAADVNLSRAKESGRNRVTTTESPD